jgi:dipeptidase E
MRLYLSSFRLGNHAKVLTEMAGPGGRALVIANAIDHYPASDRQRRVADEIAALSTLGFDTAELDLRIYFGDRDGLRRRFESCSLLWVRGGNPFLLLRALRQSGCDAIVRTALLTDAFVYGGYSAGVSVLTTSLRGIENVDDPELLAEGYDASQPVPWDGLDLLPYSVAPHYRSDHPESPMIERTVQHYIDHHVLFRALRDGQVIVVRGPEEHVLA